MADLPLMPKATAVWLVDNTTLTFDQIAAFTGLHPLEVEGIADGDVAQGIKGVDPVLTGQVSREELARAEKDPRYKMRLSKKREALAPEPPRKGPRYTPLSKRQERPAAIAWLVRYHPELPDNAIMKLVGTTKPTIESVRNRTHWNIQNIRPVDPVALGFCKQTELDEAVRRAASKKAKDEEALLSDEEKMRLMSTEQSLSQEPEPRLPSSVAGLENFRLTEERPARDYGGGLGEDPRDKEPEADLDPESLFNLPQGGSEEEDEEEDDRRR